MREKYRLILDWICVHIMALNCRNNYLGKFNRYMQLTLYKRITFSMSAKLSIIGVRSKMSHEHNTYQINYKHVG